jgi:hypothetical protein
LIAACFPIAGHRHRPKRHLLLGRQHQGPSTSPGNLSLKIFSFLTTDWIPVPSATLAADRDLILSMSSRSKCG